MKQKWLTATAVAGILAISPALAQEGQQQEPQQTPQSTEQQQKQKEQQPTGKQPEQQQPTGQQVPEEQQPQQTPPGQEEQLQEKQLQPEEQKPETISAMGKEQLVGKGLYGSENRRVGKIRDVVQNPQGEVEAVLIKVGGFFGFGGKEVAVPADELEARGDRIVAAHLTQKDIEKLPKYQKAESEEMK